MNRLSEGYKRVGDQNWGCIAKIKNQIFWPRIEIFGPKNIHFWLDTIFWPRLGKVVQRKKYQYQFVFQPLGRLGYQLDWIDGGLEFTDKGLVFGPPVRFGLEGRFI